MDVHAIWILLIAAVPIVGMVSNFYGILDKTIAAFRWLSHRFSRAGANGFHVPGKTVIAMADARINSLMWTEATLCNEPGLQLLTDLNVTNVWIRSARLLSAQLRLRRWFFITRIIVADPWVTDGMTGISGRNPIHSGWTASVRVAFLFRVPEIPTTDKTVVGDVCLIDQFNNRHWLRRLKFKHPSKISY